MLIEVKGNVISTEVFSRKFVCDLNACKGSCCIEGDAGAPLEAEEVTVLEKGWDAIRPYMRKEGIEAIEENGVSYLDTDGEPVTQLVNGKECAYVYFDENGITKCSIEQAHKDGKTDFKKPISCHLYPIRMKKFHELTALSYNEWDICAPACSCGEQLNIPVFRFLKEALIRAFGEDFYNELEVVAKEISNA